MQKAKFQIKGMHCNSCAILIEEKLKDKAGIIKTRVNYDSQKAVVIYDEQKIAESEIRQIIEGVGNYQVEKIEEEERFQKKGFQNDETISYKRKECQSSSRASNSLKLLTGLVIVSLGLNIVSLVMLAELLPLRESQNGKKFKAIADDQVLPSQSNPANQQPFPNSGDTAIQTFKITKSDHIRGDFNAPITLVEFSDFECPFCERHFPTMNKLLDNYKGKVRLVYKHFPLGFHSNAQKAAEASECADEQGKFWEYHDKIFENQSTGLSVDKFKQWAKDLDLNDNKFDDCLDSGKYTVKVQSDLQEGAQKGVDGTPATFINGRLVSGAQPYETFKQVIDNLLNQ